MENIVPTPLVEDKVHSPAYTSPALAYPLDKNQLNQVTIPISIVSNSHLLHEALVVLLKVTQSIKLVSFYVGNVDIVSTTTNPPSHLVLLDSGIGRDLLIIRIQQWRSLNPSPSVVALELKNDTDLILSCIEAGAHAYALQGASSTEISQIIDQVSQGAFQCPPEITAKLFERLSQSKTVQKHSESSPLTRRELEVLHYVAKSYSDREIASQLVIEVRTVKHHVHNILQKMKARNRWEAAQLALKNRWLDSISF